MTAKFLVGLFPKPMLMLVNSPGVASPWQTRCLGLRVNWDTCPEVPGVAWPRSYPTPIGMGIDHRAPGIWALSGHPGLLVPGTERSRPGAQHPPPHFSVSIHPKRLSAYQCWAWAWGYRGELRSCPQGNRHWESSVRRPEPWKKGQGPPRTHALGPRNAEQLQLQKTRNSLIVRRRQTNKPWFIHSKEYCSAVQMNKPDPFLSMTQSPQFLIAEWHMQHESISVNCKSS